MFPIASKVYLGIPMQHDFENNKEMQSQAHQIYSTFEQQFNKRFVIFKHKDQQLPKIKGVYYENFQPPNQSTQAPKWKMQSNDKINQIITSKDRENLQSDILQMLQKINNKDGPTKRDRKQEQLKQGQTGRKRINL